MRSTSNRPGPQNAPALLVCALVLTLAAASARGADWTSNGNDIYYNAGKVGIGVTSPQDDLHVGGSHAPGILLEDLSNNGNRPHLTFKNNNMMVFDSDDAGHKTFIYLTKFSANRVHDARVRIYGSASGSWGRYSELSHDGSEGKLRTDFGDLVLDPASGTLEVDGTVKAREVIVTQQGWPDYVFASDYPLLPLDELAAKIADEGHLPGVPSADEVAEHGVGVAEMQAVLLEKIEELTLYVLALDAENRSLNERLDALVVTE